jgi:hypothetical protein
MDRFVSDEGQRAMFVTFIKNHALPFLASVVKGDRRSAEQNRLQRLWCNEISEQWEGHSPILRASNDAFREQYDRVLKPLTYEQKFALMMEPLDLPVTRIMTKEQKTQYLDAIYRHFTEQGIVLTQPEAKAA